MPEPGAEMRVLGSGRSQMEITLLRDDRCVCPAPGCEKRVRQRGLHAHAKGPACRGTFTPDQLHELAALSAAAKSRHEKRRREALRLSIHAADPASLANPANPAPLAAAARAAGAAVPTVRRRPRARRRAPPATTVPPSVQPRVGTRAVQQARVAALAALLTARALRAEGEAGPRGADAAEAALRAWARRRCRGVALMPAPGPWAAADVAALCGAAGPVAAAADGPPSR
jgi:hypothetical protein